VEFVAELEATARPLISLKQLVRHVGGTDMFEEARRTLLADKTLNGRWATFVQAIMNKRIGKLRRDTGKSMLSVGPTASTLVQMTLYKTLLVRCEKAHRHTACRERGRPHSHNSPIAYLYAHACNSYTKAFKWNHELTPDSKHSKAFRKGLRDLQVLPPLASMEVQAGLPNGVLQRAALMVVTDWGQKTFNAAQVSAAKHLCRSLEQAREAAKAAHAAPASDRKEPEGSGGADGTAHDDSDDSDDSDYGYDSDWIPSTERLQKLPPGATYKLHIPGDHGGEFRVLPSTTLVRGVKERGRAGSSRGGGGGEGGGTAWGGTGQDPRRGW
jgi:hypothetical protein